MLSTSAKQRKMFSEAEARMQPRDKLFCVGTAVALTAPVIRGVVTAIYWLTPRVYPYTRCKTAAEASTWAERVLRDRWAAP